MATTIDKNKLKGAEEAEIRSLKNFLTHCPTYTTPLGCIIPVKGSYTPGGYIRFSRTMRFQDRTTRHVRMYWHVLIYCLNHPHEELSHLDVSHICHTASCGNIKHLCLEDRLTNNQRKVCNSSGSCTGHDGHPDCIF